MSIYKRKPLFFQLDRGLFSIFRNEFKFCHLLRMLIIDHLQQSSQRSSGHLARFGWKQSEALSVGSSLTDLSERVRPACSHSALPAATNQPVAPLNSPICERRVVRWQHDGGRRMEGRSRAGLAERAADRPQRRTAKTVELRGRFERCAGHFRIWCISFT